MTQLEPALQQVNSYMRLQDNCFKAVEHELNNKKHEYYKIELLLNCCLY